MSTEAVPCPEREALVHRARDLRPILESFVPETLAGRTLAPGAFAALHEAGMYWLALPREFGGFEADPVTESRVLSEIAYADGSTGWCTFIGSITTAFPARYLSDGACTKFSGGEPWPSTAGQIPPRGTARPIEGGYIVNGRWGFGSGIRHSKWIQAGALLLTPEGERPDPPVLRVMLTPREAVTVHDNWHVAGLEGTGSSDYSLENVFVPDEMTFSWADAVPLRGGIAANIPPAGAIAAGHGGFALGVGRRALDEIRHLAVTKQRWGEQAPLASRTAFQADFARAEAGLRAATLFMEEAYDALYASAATGRVPGRAILHARLATTHMTDTAARVAEMAYRYGGGHSLLLSSPIQQCLRDLLAATQHLFVGDTVYEDAGRTLLTEPSGR